MGSPSRYRLGAVLGRGGAGEVCRAHDAVLGLDVAIKRPLSGARSARGTLEAFSREVRWAARFAHPHLVPLYDLDEDEHGVPFLVMGLADDSLEGWRGSWDELAPWLDELLSALAALHARGVLHRDVKPSNVLLAGGHVWLADLGLAGDAAELLSRAGRSEGTLGYMAPEQLAGVPERMGPGTDLYAVGRLIDTLAAGQQVPEGLASIVDALAEPDPALRPASAGRLRAALAALGPADTPHVSYRQPSSSTFSADGIDPLPAPEPRSETRAIAGPLPPLPAAPRPEAAQVAGVSLRLLGLRELPSVGREPELHRLWDLARRSLDGGVYVAVIRAEAMVGAGALARSVAQGLVEAGTHRGFRLDADPTVSDGGLRGLARLLGRAPEAGPAGTDEALNTVVDELGRQPSVLLVDAADRMDADARRLLDALRLRAARPQVLVLLVVRAPAGAPAQIQVDAAVELEPLPQSVVADTLHSFLRMDRDLANSVAARSDGRLLLARAIVQELAEGGRLELGSGARWWSPEPELAAAALPRDTELVLWRRVERELARQPNPGEARAVLARVALAGTSMPEAVFREIAAPIAERILALTFLSRSASTVRFEHAVLRDVVAAMLPAGSGADLVAAAFEAHATRTGTRFDFERGAALAAGGRSAEAVERLLSAAHQLLQSDRLEGAAAAAALAESCIASVPNARGELLALQAQIRDAVGDSRGAVPLWRQALLSLAAAGQGTTSATASQAWSQYHAGLAHEAFEAFQRSVTLASAHGDAASEARARIGFAVVLEARGLPSQAEGELRAAVDAAQREGNARLTLHARRALAFHLHTWRGDDGSDCEAVCREALVVAVSQRDSQLEIETFRALSRVLAHRGDLAGAEDAVTRAESRAAQTGRHVLMENARNARAVLLRQLGRLAEAREIFERSVDASRSRAVPQREIVALMNLCQTRLLLRDFAPLPAELERLAALLGTEHRAAPFLHAAHAARLLASGAFDAAETHVAALEGFGSMEPDLVEAFVPIRDEARRTGQPSIADRVEAVIARVSARGKA